MVRIIFVSDLLEGKNPYAIYEAMANAKTNGKYSDCNLLAIATSLNDNKKPIRYDIAVTSNKRFLGYVNKQPSKHSMIVNTHHGCGFLGDFGKESGIDIHLAVSDAKKAIFVKNGCDPSEVFVVGQPRLDFIFQNKDKLGKIREEYLVKNKLNPDRPTLIYAPTWDRTNFNAGTKGFYARWCDPKEEEEVSRKIVYFTQYHKLNLIIRVHDHYAKKYEKQIPDNLYKIFDGHAHISSMRTESDSMRPMVASDIMVTDFSSIMTDFLALDRPIIFIEPHDKWVYNADTRWYLTKEERPGAVVETVDQLFFAISTHLIRPNLYGESRKEVANKMIQFFDGHSSERAAEAIINEYRRRLL